MASEGVGVGVGVGDVDGVARLLMSGDVVGVALV